MFGAVWAQAQLRKVLAAMGARVVETDVTVGHASEKFDEDGRLVDERSAESRPCSGCAQRELMPERVAA